MQQNFMLQNIKTSKRPFHNQNHAAEFAVGFIKTCGLVSQSMLEEAYEEYLHEMHSCYDKMFTADIELVCNRSKQRKNKCLENLSNHGVYEIDHNIFTLNVREANRLGYKTPGGLKFTEKWFMTREKANHYDYPVHNTAAWDNNERRKLKND